MLQLLDMDIVNKAVKTALNWHGKVNRCIDQSGVFSIVCKQPQNLVAAAVIENFLGIIFIRQASQTHGKGLAKGTIIVPILRDNGQ